MAALIACVVILYNGIRLSLPALNEVMDGALPVDSKGQIRNLASRVDDVLEVEKSRARKSGLGLLMDIHVLVQEDLTVKEVLEIGHTVMDILLGTDLKITDVTVHIESGKDYPKNT